MDITVAGLDNGLQVVAVPMPGMYSVTISVLLNVGSRHETEAQAGSAHLIEHMLFKGTRRRPSAAIISETIERVGGMMNAGTDKDQTVYWVRVGAGQLSLAGDLLADIVRHSRFEAAEVKKERRVVLEELGMSLDDPQDWIHSVIDEQCWPGTALGREILGTRESVPRLSRAGLLQFMGQAYQPSHTVVSVAGAVEANRAVELMHGLFGDWLPAEAGMSPSAVVAFEAHEPTVFYDERDTEQVNLCLAAKGLHQGSKDRFALDLLTTILGGGMSSRLFLEVRERKALAYDINTYTNRFADTGSVVTNVAVDPKNAPAVVEEVLRQMRKLCDEPVPDSELLKAKEFSKGRLLLGLEDTQSVSSWCGTQLQLHGAIMQPEDVCAAIDKVASADIQRIAQTCFRNEYLRLAALGPAIGSNGLKGILCLT
jgi:predicted Zn-dependent peptidase